MLRSAAGDDRRCGIGYRILHDGRGQILNIALPGDAIGFPASFFERALFSVAALGDVLVSAVQFAGLIALFCERPRLAAAILWSVLVRGGDDTPSV